MVKAKRKRFQLVKHQLHLLRLMVKMRMMVVTKGMMVKRKRFQLVKHQLHLLRQMEKMRVMVKEKKVKVTAFDEHRADVDIQTVRLFVKNVPDFTTDRSKNDLGFLSWDLKANLTHLFNWNVKQLFLYLTAEYETADNKLNQVVLWDKIIQRGENAVLDYKGLTTKYYFWDDGNGLIGNKNVTMTL